MVRAAAITLLLVPAASPPERAAAAPAAPAALSLPRHLLRAKPSRAPALVTPSPRPAAPRTASPVATLAGLHMGQVGPRVEPPDTQVAVGPTEVIETVNAAGAIWSKASLSSPPTTFDLGTFLGSGGLAVTDSRVMYDTLSSRWFLSALEFDLTPRSQVVLAVSKGSAPTNSTSDWIVYVVSPTSPGTKDQPRLGISSDKVVVTWDDFDSSGALQGTDGRALLKSDLTSGAPTPVSLPLYASTPNGSAAAVTPAEGLTAGNDLWLAVNENDIGPTFSPQLGLWKVSGTPVANTPGSITVTVVANLDIQPTFPPPAAAQPGGQVDTGDDRFNGATWANGSLWTWGNDECLPDASGTSTACVPVQPPSDAGGRAGTRLVEVDTATPAVVRDFDAGLRGADLYYAALAADGSGNLTAGFTESSASVSPSAAYAVLAGGTCALTAPASFTAGTATPYAGSRWGDYSAAVTDPSDSSTWVAEEYDDADAGNTTQWGTAITNLTFAGTPPSGPCVDAVTPASGPAAGGTTVTIDGDNFFAGTTGCQVTNVTFGGVAAPPPSNCSNTRLTVTSPGHGAGVVNVRVATSAGTSAVTWADRFNYLASSPQWSGWAGLGGQATGGPAAIANTDGRLEYFWRQGDGSVAHNWQTASSASGWSGGASLGGSFPSDPLVTRNSDGRLELFIRAGDSTIWHNWQTPASASGWSGWVALGGSTLGTPAVAVNADSRLELFTRAADQSIWHSWQTPASASGWSPWAPLGGSFSTAPAVALNGDGRLEAFTTDGAGALAHDYQTPATPSGWSGWSSIGGSSTTQPSPILDTLGRINVFTRQGDGSIGVLQQDPTQPGGWSAPASLGGSFPGRPVVAQDQDGDLELFATGYDNAVWHNWQWGSGMASAWTSLGGQSYADPAVATNSDGRLELFTRFGDSTIGHDYQTLPNAGV